MIGEGMEGEGERGSRFEQRGLRIFKRKHMNRKGEANEMNSICGGIQIVAYTADTFTLDHDSILQVLSFQLQKWSSVKCCL